MLVLMKQVLEDRNITLFHFFVVLWIIIFKRALNNEEKNGRNYDIKYDTIKSNFCAF